MGNTGRTSCPTRGMGSSHATVSSSTRHVVLRIDGGDGPDVVGVAAHDRSRWYSASRIKSSASPSMSSSVNESIQDRNVSRTEYGPAGPHVTRRASTRCALASTKYNQAELLHRTACWSPGVRLIGGSPRSRRSAPSARDDGPFISRPRAGGLPTTARCPQHRREGVERVDVGRPRSIGDRHDHGTDAPDQQPCLPHGEVEVEGVPRRTMQSVPMWRARSGRGGRLSGCTVEVVLLGGGGCGGAPDGALFRVHRARLRRASALLRLSRRKCAAFACSARRRRSSGSSTPSGSTFCSK